MRWSPDSAAAFRPSLSAGQWRERARLHQEQLAPWIADWRERRARGQAHPVADFLFTYYSYSPGQLGSWHPDPEEVLEEDGAGMLHFLRPPYVTGNGVIRRDPALFHEKFRWRVAWTRNLCREILARPNRHACHGLHEWAMVYRLGPEEARHQAWPLRLFPADLRAFVEEQALVCTHYDAFRFFTTAAGPRNAWQPTLETRLDMEQGGCIHTNMDLYKWSYKLMPWLGSDFVRETFLFAVKAREVDMRASPYDFQAIGYEPIPIETAPGRKQYELIQRELAAEAEGLRQRLLAWCESLLDANGEATSQSPCSG